MSAVSPRDNVHVTWIGSQPYQQKPYNTTMTKMPKKHMHERFWISVQARALMSKLPSPAPEIPFSIALVRHWCRTWIAWLSRNLQLQLYYLYQPQARAHPSSQCALQMFNAAMFAVQLRADGSWHLQSARRDSQRWLQEPSLSVSFWLSAYLLPLA